jgi:hypothetical protein
LLLHAGFLFFGLGILSTTSTTTAITHISLHYPG